MIQNTYEHHIDTYDRFRGGARALLRYEFKKIWRGERLWGKTSQIIV